MSGFALSNKAFFSAVIFAVNCQKGFPSSRRFTHLKSHDSLNPGISCQPVTAPHWRCHPNTQTIAWWNHRRYEGRQISHTRWHTRLSATSGHLLEDLLPDLLHLANQNSAGCYLITHFIVSHHPRLHWPFHFFSLGIFLLLLFKNLSFSIIKPTHVYLPPQVFPHYSIRVQAMRESWHWWLWAPVCVLSGPTTVLRL